MILMRELSWNVFSSTGDIESYLLYKEHEKIVLNLNEQVEQLEETTDALG